DGFLSLGAENDGSGIDFARRTRDAVNVENAAGAIASCVHQEPVGHGVRNQSAISGVERVSNGGERGIEIGMCDAAAFAWTAIVAWAAAIKRSCKIRRTRQRGDAAHLFLYAI